MSSFYFSSISRDPTGESLRHVSEDSFPQVGIGGSKGVCIFIPINVAKCVVPVAPVLAGTRVWGSLPYSESILRKHSRASTALPAARVGRR